MSSNTHIPRKRFGQHFLHDQHVIAKIVQAIAPTPAEHLVEIGPGQGALTTAILPLVKTLDVVELDRDLIPYLQAVCEDLGDLKVHQADALKFDFSGLVTDGRLLRIIGNLPYNISTPLIFHLLDSITQIKDMHFMLQKEVAERMVATPGSEHYGRLSVMVQYHCQIKLLFNVGPHSFTPPPKVMSSFLRLLPAARPVKAHNLVHLQDIVRQSFSHRRKMLRNCLKGLVSVAELESIGIAPDIRPEQLAVEDFVRISNIVDEGTV